MRFVTLRSATLVAFESTLIVSAVVLAAWLRLGEYAWTVLSGHGLWKIGLVALVAQGCLYYADLYNERVTADRRELVLRILQALGAASLAAAHHSPAMFDMTTTVVIEGTVKKVVWGNPHTYMEIETVDTAGQPIVQNVEAGPTAVLFTGGVTMDSLRAGDRVTLRAAL